MKAAVGVGGGVFTMDELEELVIHSTAHVEGGGLSPPPEAPGDDVDAGNKAFVEMSVDEVIEEHVGSLGCSQVVHVFLVSLAWVFDAQSTLVTIFADAQPAWRCKAGASPPGGCPSSMCGLGAGDWEWVLGEKSSTVAEWGLVCDRKFRAGIPASFCFLGSLLGSAVYGELADKYLGRKRTMVVSCVLGAITGLLTSVSPNVWVYALLRFSNGFARSGIGICCLVLSTEAVGRKWRAQVGQYGFFFFTLGFLSLPVIAYPTRSSWRNIYRVISLLPLAYSCLVLPFVSESPRWLAVRGRTKEAIDVLNRLAKTNGRKLPPDLSISNPVAPTGSEDDGARESLWSARWAVRRMVLMIAAGLGVGFVYYGVQLNVENLRFNLYFTVAVNALMEIPAVILGSVLLSFTDRRLLFSASSCVAGALCIACTYFGRGSWGQLGAEAVGFMAASTAYDVLYIYCVELFPTNVRNFAVSVLSQALMLGGAVAPLLVVVGRVSPRLSFLVFGCLAVLSGAVTLWLPETRNAPLYETMQQQQQQQQEEEVGGEAEGGRWRWRWITFTATGGAPHAGRSPATPLIS